MILTSFFFKCRKISAIPTIKFFQGTLQEMLLNSLDILTFVVPPILPAALTANNAFAQKRLEKEDVYCLHSKHIPLCGGIDICAFDKVRRHQNFTYHLTLDSFT